MSTYIGLDKLKSVYIDTSKLKSIYVGLNKVYNSEFTSGYVGVQIDESNSSPSDAVTYPQTLTTYDASGNVVATYSNSAYGATPMSGAGSTFNGGTWVTPKLKKFIDGIKPMSFNGSVWTELNRQSEDSWPTDRDCFTEFPLRWLSISKSGNIISVVFATPNVPRDSTFTADAFLTSDGLRVNNEFHLGCYTASGSTSAVYSKKGTSNLVNIALNRYWVAAAGRNGSTAGTNYGPYDCLPYAMCTYIQALFLVLYKSRNCQTAHSRGYVDAPNYGSVQSNSGFSSYGNDYGQYGSTTDGKLQNAFFWLHNLWGNVLQFSASLFTRPGSSKELYYMKQAMSKASNWDNSSWDSTDYRANMNSIGESTGKVGWSGGYFTKACGNNTAGFCPVSDSSKGSSSTYWPDYGGVSAYTAGAYFTTVSGRFNDGDNTGLFRISVNHWSSESYREYGSRLAYRGGRT